MKTSMMINQRDEQGNRHGPWVVHYENGQLSYKGEYKNGKRYGLWKYYLDNGQLWYKGEFRNSKRIGLWYRARYI